MLDTKKVRLLLRIDEEDINEEDLQQYIDYFIETTLARIGPAAEKDTSILENPTFEEAVMAAIACRLSLTELDIIHAPSGYKVGPHVSLSLWLSLHLERGTHQAY